MTETILEFFSELPNELYVLIISALPIIELRGAIPIAAVLGTKFYVAYPISVIGNMLPVPFILLFISGIMDYLYKFRFFRPIIEKLRKKADKHSKKVLGKSNPYADLLSVASETDLGVDIEESEPLTDNACDTEVKANLISDAENMQDDIGKNSTDSTKITDNRKPPCRKMSSGVFITLILFVAIPLPGTGAWTGSLVSSLFGLPKRKSLLAIFIGVLISGVIMTLASYGIVGFLSFIL